MNCQENKNKPIRLGYFIPEFPSQTHAFFWREYCALRDLGADISLLSTRQPEVNACRHSFNLEARANTHYVFPPSIMAFWLMLFTRPRLIWRCVKYIFRLKQANLSSRIRLLPLIACATDLCQYAKKHQLQHIHAHSMANVAHLVAMCHLLGGPTYSVAAHGDLQVYGTDHRAKLAGASFLVAVTRPLISQLLQNTNHTSKSIHLIWMGVNTDDFQPTHKREYVQNRLHLVTIARLHRTKGHRYALQAVRHAVDQGYDIRYTIAGSGPHSGEIEATIRELNLTDRVSMAGMVDENGVKTLLRNSDAFVLSSSGFGEAAPVSVMEAMASGLPVICSRIGGTPDMLEDGVDGLLVDQRDVGGLTSAIIRLASDTALRQKLANTARLKAVNEFDCRTVAKKLYDILHRNIYPKINTVSVEIQKPTQRIGFMIPQFPEPTHTFFWREHQRLARRGIACDLVSTHLPVWPYRARHEWVNYAISQTTYLHDRGLISWMKDFWDLACTDPRRLARCLDTFGLADVPRPSEHLRLVAALLLGAKLRRIAKQRGWKHIHAHSCANTLNVAMFCNLLGGPTYSMTLHGPLADYGSNQAQKWLHASFAIVITERLREAVVKQLPVKCQPLIHVAGMGVEPSKFVRSTPYTPPSRTNAISLFTCSRLNPAKRIQDLIRATALSRQCGLDLQLKIAGEDENNSMGTRRLLEKEIERLDLTQHVRLLGSIAESEVREQLEQCHLFALVSLEEPLGVATMEAMAMQVPVIITGTGGAVELVHHKVHGLHVEPRHPEQIADAIEWFVNHPDEAYTMGQRCRQRVEALYHSGVSAEVISSEVRRLYPQTEKA